MVACNALPTQRPRSPGQEHDERQHCSLYGTTKFEWEANTLSAQKAVRSPFLRRVVQQRISLGNGLVRRRLQPRNLTSQTACRTTAMRSSLPDNRGVDAVTSSTFGKRVPRQREGIRAPFREALAAGKVEGWEGCVVLDDLPVIDYKTAPDLVAFGLDGRLALIECAYYIRRCEEGRGVSHVGRVEHPKVFQSAKELSRQVPEQLGLVE